jgi:phosphomannomutase
MKKEIFKAYDIRGIYPTEIDEADAYAIGRAVVLHLNPSVVGVGRDVRTSSPSLFENFTRGIMDGGANVLSPRQWSTLQLVALISTSLSLLLLPTTPHSTTA